MSARRRGGRGRTQSEADKATTRRSQAYRQLRHPFTPQSIFSEDAIANIHNMALKVLAELGIRILLPDARNILQKADASVEHATEMVRFDGDLVNEALKLAPRSIRLRAAAAEREQVIENGAMLFYPGAGCPNVTDLERGRRPGSRQAFEETIKLQQSFDVIHMFGPSAEPQDVPTQLRHYEMMRTQM